jgi:phage host-nuclease inhibitor protein Gam
MEKIERATSNFAEARTALADLIMSLQNEIEAAKRINLPAIRKAVARAAERKQVLTELLNDNRPLFEKPKTRVLHGVKVGFQKQPGSIEIADEEATLARIKKMFGDQEDMLAQLIKTTEKPIKDALGELSGDQLKKLGVKVTDDTDKVVIKPADSEVDKIVDALLKGTEDGE